ncbi:unnamed protein product [Nezara viridula]|uniref:Discoidin domain-containing protein n=1 Tax=Nezara viridula TaxID=85310 RepID=A0A9P0H2N9_NEZVI|nr:unnamed protein product [Nezara viridula]
MTVGDQKPNLENYQAKVGGRGLGSKATSVAPRASPQGVVSYSLPRGSSKELSDVSYDGEEEEELLVKGLGRLVDGIYGGDNFKMDIGLGHESLDGELGSKSNIYDFRLRMLSSLLIPDAPPMRVMFELWHGDVPQDFYRKKQSPSGNVPRSVRIIAITAAYGFGLKKQRKKDIYILAY